jgi:hypothetical protein
MHIALAIYENAERFGAQRQKIKETLSFASPLGDVLVVDYKLSNYALPALNPACSICSRAASAVE